MTLNVAVVGTGDFARQHLLALAQIPEVRVVSVSGSSVARAEDLARLAPGARGTTDVDAAVADPDVDAVDVCNATPDHARAVIAAGQAEKHVLVDKPATVTVARFDEMVAAVEGNGRTLTVGQTIRFQPIIRRVHAALASGNAGEARLIHVSWYTSHVWPGGWRAWQFDSARSGGHPVHNGVHSLDLATWLIGSPPVEVFARHFPSFAAEMPMPDSFHMQVRFDNGALATLEHCYALRAPGSSLRRLMVAATQATILHDSDTDLGLSSPGHPQPVASVEGALVAELRHWTAMIAGEEAPIVTTAQARSVLATAVAAQRSLQTGAPQRVEQAAA